MAIWPRVSPVVVGNSPRTYRSKLVCRAGGRLYIGDLSRGIEAVLREDGDFVGIDGRVGTIQVAGHLHDAAGGEIAKTCASIKLGLALMLMVNWRPWDPWIWKDCPCASTLRTASSNSSMKAPANLSDCVWTSICIVDPGRLQRQCRRHGDTYLHPQGCYAHRSRLPKAYKSAFLCLALWGRVELDTAIHRLDAAKKAGIAGHLRDDEAGRRNLDALLFQAGADIFDKVILRTVAKGPAANTQHSSFSSSSMNRPKARTDEETDYVIKKLHTNGTREKKPFSPPDSKHGNRDTSPPRSERIS